MRTLRRITLLSLLLIRYGVWAQTTKPARNLNGGLLGEYFAGPNFERKVMTRIDPQVDFNWNWQSPGPGVPREYFSVRWTGKLYAPTAGKYRFSATADDGVRVWVNGKNVIDEWRKQDDSNFVGEIALDGHRLYDLRIEYYNDWRGSVISVFWEPPADRRLLSFTSTPRLPIPAKYLFSKPVLPADKSKPIARVVVSRPTPSPVPSTAPRVTGKPVKQAAAAASFVSTPAVSHPSSKPVTSRTVSFNDLVVTTRDDHPVTALKAGDVVTLHPVLFPQSDYVLPPDSYAELAALLHALQERPTMHIEVAGHTDNVGDKRLNLTLSEYRARVVATYLIRHGIAAERVSYKGYGGSRPIVSNDDEVRRAQNRRVEFVVTEP